MSVFTKLNACIQNKYLTFGAKMIKKNFVKLLTQRNLFQMNIVKGFK